MRPFVPRIASRLRTLARPLSTTHRASSSLISSLVPIAVGFAAGATFLFVIRPSETYSRLEERAVLAALQRLDPETAHGLAVRLASLGLAPKDNAPAHASLRTRVFNLDFSSPVGLAAGFDKQGEAMDGLLRAGFAFVEVGTVTPLPQPGNPKPRMFRLPEDGAVINRFGFNSDGIAAVLARVDAFRSAQCSGSGAAGIVGVNVGKNKEGDPVRDFTAGVRAFTPVADYLVVNVSSPNTPGLRALQGRQQLTELLIAARDARDSAWGSGQHTAPPPLLIKIAPDMSDADLEDVAAVALDPRTGVDGLILTNTTVARPESLRGEARAEAGGLSGRPLMAPSTAVLRRVYALTQGRVPIIGVGGVASGADAYAKIRAGASLVQVYSALAYHGVSLVPRIKAELAAALHADGFANIAEAVGADVPEVQKTGNGAKM